MRSSSFNPTSSPSNSCTSSPRSTQLGRNRIILEQDLRLDFFVPAPPVKQIIIGGTQWQIASHVSGPLSGSAMGMVFYSLVLGDPQADGMEGGSVRAIHVMKLTCVYI